jgi:VCBS repeat-containing protein
VSTAFTSFSFKDAHGNDVTSSLTAAQQAAIAAVEASLSLTASPSNANDGSVAWSYDVPDDSLAFLADGETLTLTYLASVDDGHGGTAITPITVTIIGSSDVPHLITELPGHTGDSVDHDTVTGTLAFGGAPQRVW